MAKKNLDVDEKMKRKKGPSFTEDETHNFLLIWKSPEVQNLFKSHKRHNVIFNIIAEKHNESGFSRIGKDLKYKLQALKSEYRKKKPRSGDKTPDWPFWHDLHSVFGQKDLYDDSVLTDSMRDYQSSSRSSSDNSDYEEADHTKQKQKSAVPKTVKKIPRRNKTDDAKDIQSILDHNKEFDEWFKNNEEEKKKEDSLIAGKMSNFMDVAVMYMQHQMAASSSSTNNSQSQQQHASNDRNLFKSTPNPAEQVRSPGITLSTKSSSKLDPQATLPYFEHSILEPEEDNIINKNPKSRLLIENSNSTKKQQLKHAFTSPCTSSSKISPSLLTGKDLEKRYAELEQSKSDSGYRSSIFNSQTIKSPSSQGNSSVDSIKRSEKVSTDQGDSLEQRYHMLKKLKSSDGQKDFTPKSTISENKSGTSENKSRKLKVDRFDTTKLKPLSKSALNLMKLKLNKHQELPTGDEIFPASSILRERNLNKKHDHCDSDDDGLSDKYPDINQKYSKSMFCPFPSDHSSSKEQDM